jgi:hypothetical protein
MAIWRDLLLRRKLEGQAANARDLLGAPGAAAEIARCAEGLDAARTPAELLVPEAAAASAYFNTWRRIELRWARKDQTRIPDHWRAYPGRTSPLSNSPRLAIDPANALLSYCYQLLETAARICCLSVGLDPGIGVGHHDLRSRASLALDLCEVGRPAVDRVVLELLQTRTWRARDFVEGRRGDVRLVPPLTHELVGMLPAWERELGPVVEGVARALTLSATTSVRRTPTPLTGTNRIRGRATPRRSAGPRAHQVALASRCISCGGPVSSQRERCAACHASWRAEQIGDFVLAGVATLAERRARGERPGLGGEAGRQRGRKNAAHIAAVRAWEAEHPERPDPAVFAAEILPGLRGVPLRTIAAATGLSVSYAAEVRGAKKIAHPRHWPALRKLVEDGP